MSVEIIQVQVPEAEGWGEWAWRKAKDRPYLAALAAPAVVVAAPFIATTTAAVAAATAGGLVAAGAGEMMWGPNEPPRVTLYSADEAAGMLDNQGQPLSAGMTYLRHPRTSETAVIIRSPEFHSFIMSQKVAEIIDYIRSETRLESLSILIRSSDSKHAVIGGRLEAIPVKARADLENQHERRINLTYKDPARTAHRRQYAWIDEFPEVIAATRNARRGTMSFAQSTDMSFGLSGEAAKFLKLQAGWLQTFVIEVDAAFA